LTQIEAAFKCLKSDLGIRPIYHQREHRVEAHILIAFLAYCLTVTLKYQLQVHAFWTDAAIGAGKAGGDSNARCGVSYYRWPLLGRSMPRYTEPKSRQKILLHQLKVMLPQQPPPRIRVSSPSTPTPIRM